MGMLKVRRDCSPDAVRWCPSGYRYHSLRNCNLEQFDKICAVIFHGIKITPVYVVSNKCLSTLYEVSGRVTLQIRGGSD
jgi:hypothetical protein